MSNENWRRIQGFRGASRLRVSVSADAVIQLRTNGEHHGSTLRIWRVLSAGETYEFGAPMLQPLPPSFSVWLKSDDPNCQCQIQAEYIEETTHPIIETYDLGRNRPVNMAVGYGLMGLGIPMLVSGLPLDVRSLGLYPYADIGGPIRPQPYPTDTIGKDTAKQDKPQTPTPGITRLQAFKRELEEEKPKEKEVKKKK